MDARTEEIERIVREVLQRLNGQSDTAAIEKDEASQTAREGSEPKEEGVLEINRPVICLADVDGRVDSVKQLVVSRGAVVTPAVRDLLRRSGVELTYRVPSRNGKVVRLAVAVGMAETNFEPTALLKAVGKIDAKFELLTSTDLIDVVDELTKNVIGGGYAVLLTSQVTASLCLANRISGVRAVCGVTVQEVARMLREVGGNLLVLDPSGKNLFEIRQMIGELVRGSRQAPERLRSRLA